MNLAWAAGRIYGLLRLMSDLVAPNEKPYYDKPVVETRMEVAALFSSGLSIETSHLISAIGCRDIPDWLEGDGTVTGLKVVGH